MTPHIVQIGIAAEPWREEAACRNYPTELFFVNAPKAVQVCAICPVVQPCLAEAQRIRQTERRLDGVWGGQKFEVAS